MIRGKITRPFGITSGVKTQCFPEAGRSHFCPPRQNTCIAVHHHWSPDIISICIHSRVIYLLRILFASCKINYFYKCLWHSFYLFFLCCHAGKFVLVLNEIFLVRQEFCAVLVGFLNFLHKKCDFFDFISGYSLNFCKSDII